MQNKNVAKEFSPHTFMIVPSMACPAACTYCFGPHKGSCMELSVLDSISDFINRVRRPKHKIKIIFHGGEPLTAGREWFEKALSILTRKINYVDYSLQSNLWLLDQQWVDLLVQYGVSVSTSLDGGKEICDVQRGEGYFECTMAGIALLRENGLDSSVIATITPAFVSKVPEVYEFFEQQQLGFTMRGAVASLSHGESCYTLSTTEMEKLYLNTFEYLEATPSAAPVRDIEVFAKNVYLKRSSLCTFSGCIGHYAAVDVDGDVYVCQRFCGEKEYSMGNVLSGLSSDDILSSLAYKDLVALRNENNEECKECSHLAYCNGGCTYNMAVVRKYNQSQPYSNSAEGSPCLYQKLFDTVQIRLAKEATGAMLQSSTDSTPYITMAGAGESPAPNKRYARQLLQAYEWHKSKAPENAFVPKNKYQTLYLNITSNCLLRCSHCSVSANASGGGFDELSLEQVLSITRQAIDIGYREISFNGGEPFIHAQFLELVQKLNKLEHPFSRLSVYTSLYFELDNQLAIAALNTFDKIIISLDGDEDEHDQRRGKGSFRRTCENISKLVSLNKTCNLYIRASLTEEQRHGNTERNVRVVAEKLSIHNVQVYSIFPIGRGKNLFSPAPVELKPVSTSYLNHPVSIRNNCGIGTNLHISPDGKAYPCWAIADTEKPIGNVEAGLNSILEKYSAPEFLTQYSVDNRKKCNECDVKYLCGGPCRSLANFNCDRLRESILEQIKTAYNILSVSAE